MGGEFALIELVCRRHTEPGVFGPGIVVVDEMWAYCASSARENHDWARIEPSSVDEVKAAQTVEDLQKR